MPTTTTSTEGWTASRSLPFGLTWSFQGTASVANGNLQATEQFLLGGESTVRGYDELVASGDSGLLVRNEIYTPPFSVDRSSASASCATSCSSSSSTIGA